jgi:hypothetical protein
MKTASLPIKFYENLYKTQKSVHMKKLFCLLVLFNAFVFCVNAQQVQLTIKKGSQGLYLEHTVAPKEGLYSLGRLYNAHPKFIAAYNKIELTGLNIGQVIQIPLTDTNFTQKSTSGVPVYYAAEANKNLTEISTVNNKVTIQKLRDWNSLSNDNITAGKKIIVGFLVSKEMTATIANNNLLKNQPANQQEKTVAKTEPQKEVKPVKTEEKPAQKQTATEDKALTKQEPPKEVVEKVKQETHKIEPVFAKEEVVVSGDQGYFKTSFEQQVKAIPVSKNETVTASIFKTTSGWQDAKYYLLIDKVPAGTIVKIINPENSKAVYAKVLGEMNGIRQNQGLNIRISNAASTALGVADTEKFIVKLNY